MSILVDGDQYLIKLNREFRVVTYRKTDNVFVLSRMFVCDVEIPEMIVAIKEIEQNRFSWLRTEASYFVIHKILDSDIIRHEVMEYDHRDGKGNFIFYQYNVSDRRIINPSDIVMIKPLDEVLEKIGWHK